MDRPTQMHRQKAERKITVSRGQSRAYDLFRQGMSVEEVVANTGRARSTVLGYLEDYLEDHEPEALSRYVHPKVVEKVTAAAEKEGSGFLKPVFQALNETVSYDDIKLVMASMRGKKK